MKGLFKKIASFVFRIAALPFYLYCRIESIFAGSEKSFQCVSQLISTAPGLFGEYLRREFYRFTLKSCSDDCCISYGTVFSHTDCDIGKGVYVGVYCTLGKVSIGDYSLLGSNVDIVSGKKQHNFSDLNTPIKFQGGEYDKIHIGEDSWIGNSAVVMADIGKKCVIGAGSVVVDNIEEYSIAAGNPAKVVKKRV